MVSGVRSYISNRKNVSGIEDLRADCQPEFTQIDCEMGFITRRNPAYFWGHDQAPVQGGKRHSPGCCSPYAIMADAMRLYVLIKPDIRFGMQFVELNDIVKARVSVFLIMRNWLSHQCQRLRRVYPEANWWMTDYIKRPQIRALQDWSIARYNTDGTLKSSVW